MERRSDAQRVDQYEPPIDRLHKAKDQYHALELEIQLLENSGYARLGAFSKVFAMRLTLDQADRHTKAKKSSGQDRDSDIGDDDDNKNNNGHLIHTTPKCQSNRRPPHEPHVPNDCKDDDLDCSQTHNPRRTRFVVAEDGDDKEFPTLFECCDELYQQFYDDQGRNLFEQLLVVQMRILALTKLCFGKHSLALAKEELIMAEIYARMDLWKQAHGHFVASTELFKRIDSFTNHLNGTSTSNNNHEDLIADGTDNHTESFMTGAPALSSRDGVLLRVLYHFYERHHHGADELDLASLVLDLEKWTREANDAQSSCSSSSSSSTTTSLPSLEPVFTKTALVQATNSMRPVAACQKSPSRLLPPSASANAIHWQDFVLFLESHEPLYQQYVRGLEKMLSDMTLQVLRTVFTTLCSRDCHAPTTGSKGTTTAITTASASGRVLLSALLLRLESLKCHDVFFGQLSATLQRLQHHFALTHLTWSELLQHGRGQHLFRNEANGFQPRLKLFLARFCLKKGAVEESLRWIQLALAEQQQLHGSSSSSSWTARLAPFHLLFAEALTIRFKQKKIVASQTALAKAEKYLSSIEGSRAMRLKALQLIEQEYNASNEILLKKQAEKQARELLLREVSSFSFVGPDQSLLDEALEHCCKVNELSGSSWRDAGSHTVTVDDDGDAGGGLPQESCMLRIQSLVLMAQVHQQRNDLHESLVCYTKAIDLYETQLELTCCVPAIAFLRVEMAQLLTRQKQFQKAKQLFQSVGEFFEEFAKEFAGCLTTRRDCAHHAIDAFRAWLVLDDRESKATGGTTGAATRQTVPIATRQDILQHMHATCQTNFGEFSLQAAQSGMELAKHLTAQSSFANPGEQLKQALKLYRKAKYIVESHFGPNDRRCRRLGQQIMQLETQLKASTTTTQSSQADEMDNTWLIL